MIHCCAVALNFALFVLIGGIPDPPAPNLDGPPTDYYAWFESAVRGDDAAEKNAADLFVPLVKTTQEADQSSIFGGFYSDRDGSRKPAPWNPKDHPTWEESNKKTKDLREQFRKAVMRPYVLPELQEPGNPARHYLVLFQLPMLGVTRTLARSECENAWRLSDEKINGATIVAGVETALRAARQCERFPSLLAGLVGIDLRRQAYRELRYALHFEALSAAQRRSAASMLARYDVDPPPLEVFIIGEYAVEADFVQRAANKSEPEVKGMELEAATAALRGGSVDARSALKTLESLRDELVVASREADFSEATRRARNASASALEKLGAVGVLLPSIDQALIRQARMLAERRALRLLLDLHAIHERTQKWPASLDDLPKDVVEKFGTDPFANKPFHYVLRDGKPWLYSVAQDGDDDGGKHDEEWGDKNKNGDFVFWPVQP